MNMKEILSDEFIAKKIAEAVNRFRTDIGNALLEKHKDVLDHLKMHGCAYINRTFSILIKKDIIVKKQTVNGIRYAFSNPQTPVHWGLFKDIRDRKYKSGKVKSESQTQILQSPHYQSLLEYLSFNLNNVQDNLYNRLKSISTDNIISLMYRCSNIEDRRLIYDLYNMYNTVWYSLENEILNCIVNIKKKDCNENND